MKNNFFGVLLAFCVSVFANEYDIYDIKGEKINTIDVYSVEDFLNVMKTEYPTSVFKERNVDLKTNRQSNDLSKKINMEWLEKTDTTWLEVKKNEKIEVCYERKIKKIEANIRDVSKTDCCFSFTSPSVTRVYQLIVIDSLENQKIINLVVDMKHLVFRETPLKIGFNGGEYALKNSNLADFENNRVYPDSERIVNVNAEYLVDKYPVTNCEFLNYAKKELNLDVHFKNGQKESAISFWKRRLRSSEKVCDSNDSAANMIYLYQALIYANQRSIAEGVEPYYVFEKTSVKQSLLFPDSSFIVVNSEKKELGDHWIKVSVNSKSNGYRLPYYDEWMFLARGGLTDGQAVWGDSSKNLSDALAYAWFGDSTSYKMHRSKPVGLLNPNGYELYDVFGLVNEFVLFPGKNPFESLHNTPSCLKGGDYRTRLHHSYNEIYIEPYWKWVNYGYSKINYGSSIGGFRLLRKIR